MAKLNCPKCPDFDGFAMCTSQPLSKVASYEWCRKYLEGLEEVNGTITLSTDLFLRLLRKAYSDAYYGAIHMEFMRDIKDVEYPLEIHIDEPKENKMDLKKALASTDTYKVDNEVAIHYGLFDWHIPMLLINEPFKKYIQEHLDEFKVEESEALPVPGPTKESRDIPVISNRRLLI